MKVCISPYSRNYAVKERVSIDLRLSENPLGLSPYVINSIDKALTQAHLYPHNEKALISKISDHYQVPEECIFLGAGANRLIEEYLKVFAIGKHIVTPTATFPEVLACMEVLNGSVSSVSLKEDFSLDLNKMLSHCRENTAFIHFCNPNNPTGIWTHLDYLNELAKQSPVPLLISEAGADFIKKTAINSSLESNIIVIRSFSKAYGLAGLRIGYSIASREIVEKMKGYTAPYQISSLSIEAAIAAIKDQEHLNKTIEYVLNEKAWLMNEMSTLGFKPIESQGQNFIAEVPLKFAGAKEFCKLAKNYDVGVVDCSIYIGLERYIRISPQLHELNEQFIDRLKSFME